jgi:plasmid stabilization system protein ParE
MPDKWTEKDERMYEHVRNDFEQRGKSNERAREAAARTVNRQRREEGRTPSQRSQGTGNPHEPLEARTFVELRNRARELHIAGRSTMNKDELVAAIRKRN